ncbi:MAG: FAD-binding oxidoreductase [Algicola sp.]|nr:FAD-binding oxidoreductase [Algicola sp.]
MSYQDLTGEVITPQSTNYDEARAIYNAMIDKKPALIVKCSNTDDVVNAVNYARENNIEVSIKSGGHNGAGLALVDDGLVIDLSEMKAFDIDPNAKTIRVDPGFTLGEIGEITQEHGLYLPFGINGTTGISGLTLGGGLGYLSRKGGLTIDNLLECEVVLANGDVVTANKNSHPDLFWALRGGGGNFGIVVSFKFKLLSVATVYGGPMIWEMDDAEETFRLYDEFTKTDDQDLYGFYAFLTVPPAPPFPEEHWNKRCCGVVWNYTGPLDKAEAILRPMREKTNPIIDFVGEMPMHQLNTLFDALYPKGLQWYWRAHFINDVSDESLAINIKYGKAIPNVHTTTHFYPIDGKVHEVANHETAWANRGVRWAQVIVGVDPQPENAQIITDWCKNYYDELIPYAANQGAYVNFMMEEGQERIKASYKDNYEKLVAVKTKYDPTNFFHINQNIKPD